LRDTCPAQAGWVSCAVQLILSAIPTDHLNTRLFRVGIIVDGLKQQAWVDEAMRDLVRPGVLEVRLVVVCSGATSRYPSAKGFLGMYAGWDRRKFRPAFDALVETDISWMLQGAQRIDTHLEMRDGKSRLGASLTKAISTAELDVVVSFLAECPADYTQCRSTYGNWYFNIGDGFPYPGLNEVLGNKPVTPAQLLLATDDGAPELVCQCNGSAATDSWRLNLSTSSWRLGALLKRAVRRVCEHGTEGLYLEKNSLDRRLEIDSGAGMCRWARIIALICHNLWNSVSWRLYRESWFSAIRSLDGRNPLESISKLVPMRQPKDAFWADPFPVCTDEGCVIFVEEAKHSDRRGRIAVLRVDEEGRCIEHLMALERPFHMSYPFVFRYDGEFYMIPQSGNNGQVEVFRCVEFPADWEYHSTILSGEKFSDATLLEHNGKWWLFTTPGTKETLPLDDLLVFHSRTPFGPWLPHKLNPVISDARHARPAGRPFVMDGKLLRPAQDCSYGKYGRAITIREIVTLSEDEFEERDYVRIDPVWARGLTKTHTFNFAGDMLVLDGCRKSWRR